MSATGTAAAAATCNSTIAVLSRSRSFRNASESHRRHCVGDRSVIACLCNGDGHRRSFPWTGGKEKTSSPLSRGRRPSSSSSSSSSSASLLSSPSASLKSAIQTDERDDYGGWMTGKGLRASIFGKRKGLLSSSSFSSERQSCIICVATKTAGATKAGRVWLRDSGNTVGALLSAPSRSHSSARCLRDDRSLSGTRAVGGSEKRAMAAVCRVAAPQSKAERAEAEGDEGKEVLPVVGGEVEEERKGEGHGEMEVEREEERFEMPPEELPEGGFTRAAVRAERMFNVLATGVVMKVLDLFYQDRPFARFYVLETIARVPYFAFLSVLHLYETFGWWRRADYLKVHFAESWNELHHLLVMEALGGDERWADRFLAQHVSVAYYFMTVMMYFVSPRMAYHFQEVVERHAYATYDKFIREKGEELKTLPAPEVAVRYYTQGDLYMFDEFQTAQVPESRRPKIDSLYDVFVNIRADEAEHCKTMRACQRPGSVVSPHRDSPTAAPTCHVDAIRRVEGNDGKQIIEKEKEEEEEEERDVIDRTRAALNAAFLAEHMVPPAECSGIIECATTAMSFSDRRRVALENAGLEKMEEEEREEVEEKDGS